jgi:hypothetical protein
VFVVEFASTIAKVVAVVQSRTLGIQKLLGM